ncbi:MAG TPA: site-specific integrase, partial [Ignavibacteriaceae bacterium]|nr:site-specific integrase [Ignavibacteriaceae bacterium]
MEIFLNEYLSVLKLEKNLAENTVASYRNDIINLIQFLQNYNINDPQQIKYTHLADFFKFLNEAGLTSSSASRYHSSLKGFFSYLYQNGYVTNNPVEKIPSPKLSKK